MGTQPTTPQNKDLLKGEIKWIAEHCNSNNKPIATALSKARTENARLAKELNDSLTEQEISRVVHGVYGIEDGVDPDNWESEFPVMGECELPTPEVIVDDLLLKRLLKNNCQSTADA